MNIEQRTLEVQLDETKQLFFLHMPKTAGRTLIQLLESYFLADQIWPSIGPAEFQNVSTDTIQRYRLFRGHIPFDILSRLLTKPPVVITVLREPVDRFISHFSYLKRGFDKNLPSQIRAQIEKMDLAEFVEAMDFGPNRLCRNRQIKLLGRNYDFNSSAEVLTAVRSPEHEPVTADIERAKDRLTQFAAVGVTEHFQEFLFMLCFIFGWPPVLDQVRLNVAPSRPKVAELPANLIERISWLNQADMALYEHGRQLFEQRFTLIQNELLERYGRREHAHLKLPLSREVMVDLLDRHYRQRFAQHQTARSTITLDLDRKQFGQGWSVLEHSPIYGSFRWSGPEPRSSIDLPLADSHPARLRFSVVRGITPAILESLTVLVNDEAIPLTRLNHENGTMTYESYLPQDLLARSPGCTRISFEVAETIRPCDVIPGSKDDRLLGIALSGLEVVPA